VASREVLEQRALEAILGGELAQRPLGIAVLGVRGAGSVAAPFAAAGGTVDQVGIDGSGEVAADDPAPDLVGDRPDLAEPLRPEKIRESSCAWSSASTTR